MDNAVSTCVLGTSSAGNSTVIWNSTTAVLIDCGFGPAYIAAQLEGLGLSIAGLKGVFITHVHGDHVNELTVMKLVRDHIPLYCPRTVAAYLKRRYGVLAGAAREGGLKAIVDPEVAVGDFHVRPFVVPHDSAGGCFGYCVRSGDDGASRKVSVSTDISRPTEAAVTQLTDSDTLVLESNYDVAMLENSGRPAWLKRRIREKGHLSNDQCGELLLRIIDQSKVLPRSVLLAHISQECNTNARAVACTLEALDSHGIRGIDVCETFPDRPSRTITV